ncbi:MAG: hypothetical protein ABI946_03435 [Chthoniobacterales bacterium]
MKSKTAFEYTIRKMEAGGKLYFWTFTYRDVHSLKTAMSLWNEFLTILKRKLGFRGVRVLELHDEHGVHFHVVTNKRFKIRSILEIGVRYGFGRTHVEKVTDVAGGIAYLCKYLSKLRAPCLKRVRLWAAFGSIERTRVCDIVVDSPFVRVLRAAMGSPSPDELLEPGTATTQPKRFKRTFFKALPIAWEKYLGSFDPTYRQRQERWASRRFAGVCQLSAEWFGPAPEFDVVEAL